MASMVNEMAEMAGAFPSPDNGKRSRRQAKKCIMKTEDCTTKVLHTAKEAGLENWRRDATSFISSPTPSGSDRGVVGGGRLGYAHGKNLKMENWDEGELRRLYESPTAARRLVINSNLAGVKVAASSWPRYLK